jgi:RNA polymerase subunit RPABC4/transcription elongation factor Spt4
MDDKGGNPYTPPASSEPAPESPLPPGYTPAGDRICPFCGGSATATRCGACNRDPSAPRVVCAHCKKMTPTAEPGCCHCGELRKSELRWKVPLIIALFVIAFAISIAVRVL